MIAEICRKFRDYLRAHGMYIPKARNVHIYTALAQAVTDNLEWPTLDLESNMIDQSSFSRTAVSPTPENNDDSKDQFDGFVQGTPRYSNIQRLFKAYSSDKEKYTGDPKFGFDHKYIPLNGVSRCKLLLMRIVEKYFELCSLERPKSLIFKFSSSRIWIWSHWLWKQAIVFN